MDALTPPQSIMERPPKVIQQEVVRRERGITRRGAAGDLPVLGAFGQFLDTERRRARNRMLLLSGFFVLILITVVGAGLFVGMLAFDQMKSDLYGMQQEVQTVRLAAEQAGNAAVRRLDGLEGVAENLRSNLAEQESALADTRTAVDAESESYEQELADMKQVLGLLEVENQSLKQDLQRLRTQWPQLAGDVERLVARLNNLEQNRPTRPAAAPRAPSVPDAPLPPGFEMTLVPRGANRGVAWRLPIPE